MFKAEKGDRVMNKSKEEQARENMRGIDRNYPGFPSTFGACANECGSGKGARGSGLCADCYEDLLAEQCGRQLAVEYHLKVRSLALTTGRVMDSLGEDQ